MEIRHQQKLIKLLDHSIVLDQLKLLVLCIMLSTVFSNEIHIADKLIPLDKGSSFLLSSPESITFKSDLNFLSTDYEYKKLFKRHKEKIKIQKITDLELKLIKLLPYDVKHKAAYYLRPIIEVSHYYGIDPLWAISIVWTESHFKVHSRSHVGAQGLMQLMPTTRKYLEKRMKRLRKKFNFSGNQVEIPLSREFYADQLRNIEIGVHYLTKLLRRFRKRNLATVAYNMGPTWTRRRLARRKPVGTRNQYLDKVSKSYKYISKRL